MPKAARQPPSSSIYDECDFHPRTLARMKAEGKIPASQSIPVGEPTGSGGLKRERAKIVEDKPKGKVVLDYFEKVIATACEDSDDD